MASKTISTAPSALNLFTPNRAATRATISAFFMFPAPPVPPRGFATLIAATSPLRA